MHLWFHIFCSLFCLFLWRSMYVLLWKQNNNKTPDFFLLLFFFWYFCYLLFFFIFGEIKTRNCESFSFYFFWFFCFCSMSLSSEGLDKNSNVAICDVRTTLAAFETSIMRTIHQYRHNIFNVFLCAHFLSVS